MNIINTDNNFNVAEDGAVTPIITVKKPLTTAKLVVSIILLGLGLISYMVLWYIEFFLYLLGSTSNTNASQILTNPAVRDQYLVMIVGSISIIIILIFYVKRIAANKSPLFLSFIAFSLVPISYMLLTIIG
jgi:hypothetical protein